MALGVPMVDMSAEGQAPSSDSVWPERRHRSLARRERQAILAIGDTAVWVASTGLVAVLTVGQVRASSAAVISVSLWLVVGYFGQIFRLGTAARIRSTFEALVRVALVVDGLLLFVSYLQPGIVSPEALFLLATSAPAAIGIWRYVGGRFIAGSKFERRVLIIGSGPRCVSLLEAVGSSAGHGVRVVGIVDDDGTRNRGSVMGIPIVGHLASVWDVVHDLEAEEVVLALESAPNAQLAHQVAQCYEHGIAVSLMPHMYGEVAGQVPVEHMASDWLGAVPLNRSGGWLYETIKRLVDVSVASVGLVLMSPVMLLSAMAVRLSSPGQALFRQERLGMHGRPFTLLKFRSMRGGTTRVTGVGGILRKTHLDELPQLVNVLRGDMSLVGPRPKRADVGRELAIAIPLYRARQSVRPGVTGWAQIVYRYAHTAQDEMIKLRYDLYYIQNRTLLLDLVILVRTAASVLGGRGT